MQIKIKTSDKVAAIKFVRLATGLGLYEAKTYVETHSNPSNSFTVDTALTKGQIEEGLKQSYWVGTQVSSLKISYPKKRKVDMSTDDVIQEISEILRETDGDFIEHIANQVLGNKVKYIEKSNCFQKVIDK